MFISSVDIESHHSVFISSYDSVKNSADLGATSEAFFAQTQLSGEKTNEGLINMIEGNVYSNTMLIEDHSFIGSNADSKLTNNPNSLAISYR